MKRIHFYGHVLPLLLFFLFAVAMASAQTESWNKQTAGAWFKKEVWLNAKPVKQLHYDTFGRLLDDDATADSAATGTMKNKITLKPHASINKEEFARQYNTDKAWWDEAFAYLQQTDLTALPAGKFSIDGDNVLVTVTEGLPRLTDSTQWESHLVYDDIHYVISGKEKIGVTTVPAVKKSGGYNPVRDLIYYTGNQGAYYEALPGTFYVFFPQDVHRPNLRIGNERDKKIVIKVRRSKP